MGVCFTTVFVPLFSPIITCYMAILNHCHYPLSSSSSKTMKTANFYQEITRCQSLLQFHRRGSKETGWLVQGSTARWEAGNKTQTSSSSLLVSAPCTVPSAPLYTRLWVSVCLISAIPVYIKGHTLSHSLLPSECLAHSRCPINTCRLNAEMKGARPSTITCSVN